MIPKLLSGIALLWMVHSVASAQLNPVLSPENNATNVALTTLLQMTFSVEVIPGEGEVSIYQAEDLLQTIGITETDRVAFENTPQGTVVTIDPDDLPEKTTLNVRMPAGILLTAGDSVAYEGITDASTWRFTTADVTPPVVETLVPATGAVDVPRNTDLSLTFSEPVEKGTGTIVVQYGAGSQNIDVTSEDVVINGNQVTISLADLPSLAVVTVQVPADAFKDLAGNGNAALSGWSFTVIDADPPIVDALSPATGATQVPVAANLEITFNEAILKGAGNITIYQNGSSWQVIPVTDAAVTVIGNKATINPPLDFAPGASIYVLMPAGTFRDLLGNNFAGINDATGWTFTVIDNVAPTATDFSPANNATGVGGDVNLVITFSEPVMAGAGNIFINQGATEQVIPVGSASVSIEGNKVTIDPPQNFPSGTKITITMPSGVFTDLAGNPYAGIASTTVWSFTVADVNAPTISSLSPADDATDVPRNVSLVITFSEPVKKGTGNITINQSGGAPQVINVANAAVTVSGATVVINRPANFVPGAAVNVQMPAGVFLDLENNPFAGINDATTWNFTAIDDVAPTVTSFSPAPNATGVATGADLIITFNENIQKGSGEIQLSVNGIVQTIDVSGANVSVMDNRATINPPADFPSGAAVNVQMPAGVFRDLAGNNYAGIVNATTWSFTVIDNIPPVVTDLSPADNAIGVAAGANLIMTFSEPVKKGTGVITINQSGAAAQTINVAAAAVTVAGNTVTINPPADFPSSAAINVQMPAGVFLDLGNNPFSGINDATTWNFTVADVNAPVVTAFNPADNATNVAPNVNLVMTFSEAVKKGTGSITINQSGAAAQTINVADAAVTVAGNTVTINPPADFPPGVAVNVQMPAGTFLDLEDNPFSGINDATTWNFVTADNVPPTITQLSPADDATGVAPEANLVITFSEPVKKGSGNININQSGAGAQVIPVGNAAVTVSGNTVTINPPADFPSGAAVNVQMPAGIFTDLAGNAFAGIIGATAWNFTVADVTAPVATAFSPADNATGVEPNTDLTITFSKAVKKGAGNISIVHGSTSQIIDVAGAAVSISENTVTINPPADFPSGVNVSVLIPSGVFTDLSGNAYAGISDAAGWNFITVDNVPPTVVTLFPANNSTGVSPNANLIMTFTENVIKGSSGTITINQGNTSQSIPVTDPAVSVSGNTVIINPPADFPAGATVTIQMPAGVFTDIAGNAFAGITGATTWSFLVSGVADTTPPTITALSPADNATGIAANTDLVITFSEVVQKGTGIITVHQGTDVQQINVSSEAVRVNGNEVTINVPKDLLAGEVYVQMPAGTFMDTANNPFAGITNATTWNFTVSPITFLSRNFPEIINSSEASVQASIEVNTRPAGMQVDFVTKGITQAPAAWNRSPITSANNIFTGDLLLTQADALGIMYYFDFTLSTGVKVASDTGYLYINYTGVGLTLSDLPVGDQVANYRIISVPLDLVNKNASAVFEDDFGPYDDTEWRLFGFESGGLQEYKNGLATIEPGKGYWLISRTVTALNSGEGSTVKVRPAQPFTIALRQGWNLIGNPYNMDVPWSNVVTHNNNPAWLKLRTFEGGFQDGAALRKQSGGFVFAEQDTTISIPVVLSGSPNGRVSAEPLPRHHSASVWEVNFSLRSRELVHQLGGAGMHPQAKVSKDAFDEIAVPRFLQYLDLNFHHPEYFAPRFAKDLVPVTEEYTWEFTVESNLPAQWSTLSWENYFANLPAGKEVWLYDVTHDKALDLRRNTDYRFYLNGTAQFRLYYGSGAYIADKLSFWNNRLDNPYPNPLLTQTTIPFVLSERADRYQVQISIYSPSGQRMGVLTDKEYLPGKHQIVWDGRIAGQRLAAGIYLCRLELISGNIKQEFTQKIVLP